MLAQSLEALEDLIIIPMPIKSLPSTPGRENKTKVPRHSSSLLLGSLEIGSRS
jgi:hypothetical protein